MVLYQSEKGSSKRRDMECENSCTEHQSCVNVSYISISLSFCEICCENGKSKLNLSSENIFKLVCLCESCEGECIVVPNRNLRKVFDQILTAAYLHVVTFKKNEKDRASELH